MPNKYLERFKNDLLVNFNAILDVNETEWKGASAHYLVICSNGHVCKFSPKSLKTGNGPCFKCAVDSRASARKEESRIRYELYLSTINVKPAWNEWYGSAVAHKVICASGHICNPIPNGVMNRGRGVCKICAGNDTWQSEKNCISTLLDIGATPLWDNWNGSQNKHKIQCKNGHICWIIPAIINYGIGPCKLCAGKEWDVFYLVHNPIQKIFKLGITSGNPTPRIRQHQINGYIEILYLINNIDARILESDLLFQLNSNKFMPFKGNEYFSDDALEFILNELEKYHLINLASEYHGT